jgi:hypothetical protein
MMVTGSCASDFPHLAGHNRARWGDDWSTVKIELRKALHLPQALHRAAWWN